MQVLCSIFKKSAKGLNREIQIVYDSNLFKTDKSCQELWTIVILTDRVTKKLIVINAKQWK